MKFLVIGDVVVPVDLLVEAAKTLDPDAEIETSYWDTGARSEFNKHSLNLEKNGPSAERPPADAYEKIADADVLLVHFCPVAEELIEAGKNLKLIGTCRGGMEHIDVPAATAHGIPVMPNALPTLRSGSCSRRPETLHGRTLRSSRVFGARITLTRAIPRRCAR